MKTVRFSRVVEAAGKPRPHTLWTAPERDPEFKRARAAHRVMTIAHAGGKSDAGTVGFDSKRPGEFLIFPKSLARFEGARIVGVKFDLVDQPKLSPAKTDTWKPPARKRRGKKASAKLIPFSLEPSAVAPSPKRQRQASKKTKSTDDRLRREVRAALQELEAGKAVAAYRRLQRAVKP